MFQPTARTLICLSTVQPKSQLRNLNSAKSWEFYSVKRTETSDILQFISQQKNNH